MWWKKRLVSVAVVVFFLFKSPGGHVITAETSGMLEFHLSNNKLFPDELTSDS